MRLLRLRYEGLGAVSGKCTYWRERLHEDDRFDPDVKAADKRVTCTCFIEGTVWTSTVGTVMGDCPQRMHCRYHITSA